MVLFWLALAVLYLCLGLVCTLFSARFGRRLRKAQPQWTDEAEVTTIGEPPRKGDSAVFSYWHDLAKYLSWSTHVSVGGFLLAAAAAIAGLAPLQVNRPAEAERPSRVVDVVKAERFELVDESGKVRARLAATSGTVGLVLSSQEPACSIMLSVAAGGAPALTMSDKSGQTRAVLMLLADGRPGLVLRDSGGRNRAIVGALGQYRNSGENLPESYMGLLGRDGKVLWTAP